MLATPWCHVWLRPTVADAPPPAQAVERARWERLRSPGDRDRLATAHHLVREAAGAALGVPVPRVVVVRRCPACGRDDHGPLEVEGLSVSVSHSGALVAVAVTGGAAVGIDVEEVGRVAPDVAGAALAPREAREHARSPTAHDLLVRWVRKEAVLKAARTGIGGGEDAAGSLRGLVVTGPDRRARVRRWSQRPAGVRRVALADLAAPPPFVGAVAVLGAGRVAISAR